MLVVILVFGENVFFKTFLRGDLKYPHLRKVVFCLKSLCSDDFIEGMLSTLKNTKSDSRNSFK